MGKCIPMHGTASPVERKVRVTLPTDRSVVLVWSTCMLSDRTGANLVLALPMVTSRRSCSEVVMSRAPPDSVSVSYCPGGFLYFGVPVLAK